MRWRSGTVLAGAFTLAAVALLGALASRDLLDSSGPDRAGAPTRMTSLALAPGGVAEPASSAASRDELSGTSSSSSTRREDSTSARAPETRDPEKPHPPRKARHRPGGSELYSGAHLSRPLVPDAVAPGAPADKKAAQLERAQDVADKRGTIVGRIEGVSPKEIAGWAYAWDDPAQPANVAVFVDGVLVGTVLSDAPRTNFAPQDPDNPLNSRGWSCPSPAVLGDGDKHVIEALGSKPGSDAQHALQNSPYAYGGVAFPQGELTWAGDRVAYGWARDPAQPTSPVTVTLSGDGVSLGKIATLGPGHNGDLFQQALALVPSKKLTIPLTGVSGPDDPNLPAAIAAALKPLVAANHYRSVELLAAAQAGANLAFDEIDFFASDAQGNATPLPGTERAGVKFSAEPDDTQAFLFVAPTPITASWLQGRVASADGSLEHELARSPLQLGASSNRLPFGAVSFVNDVQISGWAADPDVLPKAISVDVFVDGAYVQRIPADKTFAVLPNFSGLPDANHAFTFEPPDQYKDGRTHSIQFLAVNEPQGPNPELPGSPATFVGKRNANPIGWLDVVTPDQAAGWAYDPDAGSAPTSVEIWVDDVLWKTVAADVSRPDLVPIVTAEPAHGFAVPLPDSCRDGKLHAIRAFALNFPDGPKQELAQSPLELNAQSPYFGVSVSDSATAGLTISSVARGSPAAKAGLLSGDVIRSFDGISQKVDAAAFVAWAKTKEVGEQVVFRLFRDPSLSPAAPSSSTPAAPGSAPLGPGERIAVVTAGSR
jgi:hypothetical protein